MIQPAVVRDVRVSDDLITFALEDGRELSAPTEWSERLRNASASARNGFVIESDGMVVFWPEIDEHIGVWTLLGVLEEQVFAAAGLRITQPARR
jgi:hypothetical protein